MKVPSAELLQEQRNASEDALERAFSDLPKLHHDFVPHGLWRPVSDALHRLVRAVENLRGQARDLQHLPTFAQVFPTNGRLAGAGGAYGPKRRLLIVEDQIADVFADDLGDYECVQVRSLKDFWALVNTRTARCPGRAD